MSLEIVRVVGESFDLRTGQESPKGVVLTNGHHEITLPVSDEQLQTVLRFWGEGADAGPPGGDNGHVPEVSAPWTDRAPVPDDISHPATFDAPEGAADDMEPGEMYQDELTGTGSI